MRGKRNEGSNGDAMANVHHGAQPTVRRVPSEGKALRLSSVLLAVGFVLYVVAGLLHPGGPANNHPEIFDVYAHSATWAAVHLGQFAGMAAVIAGLLVLCFALEVRTGAPVWPVRLAAVSATAAFGLYGVLQAVDGVALKQAVDAWSNAPEAEKALRFANAETVRWLEWGVRSYQSFTFGAALILLGTGIAVTAKLPRTIGYLMGVSGLAYFWQGWVLGTEGFAESNTSAILGGYVLILAWIVWLTVVAWRTKE